MTDPTPEHRGGRAPRVETCGARAGGPVTGVARPPGSKSIAQRALLCAALAEGATAIDGLPGADDVAAARTVAEGLGGRVEPTRAGVRVTGRGPSAPPGDRDLRVGESGTLGRLTLAVAALAGPGTTWTVQAAGTLVRRRSPALVAALRGAGAVIEPVAPDGAWPLRVRGTAAPREVRLVDPTSSQEVSALLLALAAAGDERTLDVAGEVPSLPYVRLTIGVLERFGATVVAGGAPGGVRYEIRGPLRAVPELAVEPDASSAAVLLAAACLSGGDLRVEGLGAGSLQGDVRIVEHLRAFGCHAEREPSALVAGGFPTRAAELDLTGEPDLAPVLAAVAAGAALFRVGDRAAASVLRGLGTLPGKESSRIEVLAAGLRAAGWRADGDAESLTIGAAERTGGRSARLDPHGDHRMAFAFALLGLLGGELDVADPACVSKSWPGFWTDLERHGARVVRR